MKQLRSLGLFLALGLCLITSPVHADDSHHGDCGDDDDDEVSATTYVAASFADGFAIHGVAGDEALLFAVQPADGTTRARGVHIKRRNGGGDYVGELPTPSGGYGTPLTVKIVSYDGNSNKTRSGELLLMDNQIPPGLAGSPLALPTKIYRYGYSYDKKHGFLAWEVSAHTLPLNTVAPGTGLPNGIFYAGSIALLPQGRVAITDNAGAIWASDDASLNSWSMVLIDNRFAGTLSGPVQGLGRDNTSTNPNDIKPYTLLTPTPPTPPGAPPIPPGLGLYPGAHSIAYVARTNEVCWAVTVPGGLYCQGLDAFLSNTVPPFAKTANPTLGSADLSPNAFGSVRQVVPVTHGLGDLTDGVDYDRYHASDPWLYWQRAPADAASNWVNTLRRVNLLDGRIQVVAANNNMFDWANELSALPPLSNGDDDTYILSSVGQEHNNPDVNQYRGGVSTYYAWSPMPITIVHR